MEILFEDNHIIAVNKTTSDLVQADQSGDEPLSDKVKAYIKEKYKKPGDVFLGVVHRLDRPVSGVTIFARTSKALVRLNAMFQGSEMRKTYWAIVKEMPPSEKETITHWLVRKSDKNKSFAHDFEVKNSKKASLTYEVVCRTQNYYLLEVDLHTGRHHQIRSQLSKIGTAIKGDLKYGFPRSNEGGGISLHARKLEFIHPIKKEPVTITAKPPKDVLWNEFYKLMEA